MKTGVIFILLMFSAAFNCRLFDSVFDYETDRSDSDSSNVLLETFNDEHCVNPCWLGIEVGVSDRSVVEETLERETIDYSPNTRGTYNLFLTGNPSPLWQDMEEPLGDIHLSGETVNLIMINLDLCPASILEAYGEPEVVERGNYLELVYPSYGLDYWLNSETGRVRGVSLYRLDYIDEAYPSSERQDWEDFAGENDDECIDSLSEPWTFRKIRIDIYYSEWLCTRVHGSRWVKNSG
jgi:hypothetical protein